MANQAEVQDLLRFLTKDAKLPLATAMGKIKPLQQAMLTNPTAIASAPLAKVQSCFPGDDKAAKQVLNAAKRMSKKRAAGGDNTALDAKALGGDAKRSRKAPSEMTSTELEASLALPPLTSDETAISQVSVLTNRAPLVLAFAVMLLKYTMPAQPLSSRLSLAQAYVSVTSRARAVSLGIETGKGAEEEGWGLGQPVVKVLGKEVRVMRRYGDYGGGGGEGVEGGEVKEEVKEEGVKAEEETEINSSRADVEPALWGIDLEATKKSSSSTNASTGVGFASDLPIHTPQSARAYLLKSFNSLPGAEEQGKGKKASASAKQAEREQNLGLLLSAIDLMYQSWVDVLGPDELDRRTWGWYVRVRPDVADGVAGWGGKNVVKLADILALRRSSD